jgi:hypothetical protein
VVAAGTDLLGPLLAIALGAAVLAARPPALAQAPPAEERSTPRQEVVITAHADAAVTAKVAQALQDDRFTDTDHVTIETHNGVVILRGIVYDEWDLRRTLMLARRAAGKRRVVNEIDMIPEDLDKD